MNIVNNPESSWTEYFAGAADKPLHPLYALLDPHLPRTGEALELGCGIGNGALHLASRGLHVTAVDALEEPLEILRSKAAGSLDIRQAFIEDLELEPASFDVLVAGFCLFFIKPEQFADNWQKVVGWLKPGGLFMGQLLGPNDSWLQRERYSAQSQEELQQMFRGFEPLHWEHVERDGATVQGHPKHWDVTHVIARKRL